MNLDPFILVDLFARSLLWAMGITLAVFAFLAALAYLLAYAPLRRRRHLEAATRTRLAAFSWADPEDEDHGGESEGY